MDNKYYYTKEAAEKIGVHKDTLLRWFRQEKVKEVPRDVRGWRIFSNEDIVRIKKYAGKITELPGILKNG